MLIKNFKKKSGQAESKMPLQLFKSLGHKMQQVRLKISSDLVYSKEHRLTDIVLNP